MGPNGPHSELIFLNGIVMRVGWVFSSLLCIRVFW